MSEDLNLKMKFDDAVKRANNLPNQPPEVLLEMYGLYKQALVGDVTGKRPGRVKIKARYKYDAWVSKKGISQEEAMKLYIELIEKLEST
jgi:diazepam-binding inhibitor (GABA receptor modulating acyl-CoA-binding protein)